MAETGIAEADAQFGLEAEALEGGGEGVNGFRVDEEGGVADDFGQAGDPGDNSGRAEAHCLEGGESEAFGEGGQDESEAVAIEPGESRVGDVAGGENAIAAGEGVEDVVKAGAEPAFAAGEDEVGAVGELLAEAGPGLKEAREVFAGLEGGNGEEEVGVGESGESGGAGGWRGGGVEPAGEGDGDGPVLGVVGKDVEELAPAELGDRDDEVGAEAGVQGTLEAAEAVGFLAPIGMDEEVEVVEGPDKAGLREPGWGEEAVEVEKFGVAEPGFEGLRMMGPEAPGAIEGGGRGAEAPAEAAGAHGAETPVWVEEEVADDGVEDELVGRTDPVKGTKKFGGNDATAGFAETGLADVIADSHEGSPEGVRFAAA